jgi:4-hydroxyphenylpyruvate dioxygenase-like putative hemolysin
MQLGYVARNLNDALDHWVRVLGVGPFFVTDTVPYAEISYRGRAIEIATRVAIAYHGTMQIEVIEQTGGDASMFTDFLDRRGGGLHHVCAVTDDLAALAARFADRGVGVLQGGRTMAGIPFAYFDTDPDDCGRVLEVVQPTPGLTRFFDKLQDAAQGWDGQDPIRRL